MVLYACITLETIAARSWLAKTIVPWTAEWLFLYELWLETGMWWGLEASHNNSKSKKR